MAPKPIGSSAQFQDITQVLKGITDFYPPESCLRELMQNADDAEATEMVRAIFGVSSFAYQV